MATTPEHVPHIPHIPLPDMGRGAVRWTFHHLPLVGGAAVLGVAGIMALTHDRGPQTAPVDNAPISDTLKSPEGGANVSLVPVSPAETVRIDKRANVDAAVKNGEIQLNGEQDLAKYFTPVTPAEAAKILEGNSGYLLNFDPTKSPNLIMKTIDIPTPTGIVHLTGIKNIGPGTIVYASESGIATIRSGNSGEDLIYSLKVQNGNRLTGTSLQRAGSQPLITTDEEVFVGTGTPLASIGGVGPLSRFSGAQVVTGFGIGVRQNNQGSLDQLARTADGGIAYISQAPQG